MIVLSGRTRALARALLALSVLTLAPVADAQLQGFNSGLGLFRDLDGSGDASCGDEVHSRVIISSHIGAEDLTNLTVTWPVPAGAHLIPNTATVGIGPESDCTLISGDLIGDTHVTVYCPFLCRTGGTDPGTCTQVGIDIQAMLKIREPNAADELAVWAVATADQIEPTVSNTAVLGFTPCPAALPPVLEATLVDELEVDLDGDGAVDPGDSIIYTLRVTNVGGTRADQVVFAIPPPEDTSLLRGSVSTTSGEVTRGNEFGDQTVEVVIAAIDPGQSVTITFVVAVDPGIGDFAIVSAQGAVSADNAPATITDDPATTSLNDPTLTPIDEDPDLAIDVQPFPAAAAAGERITWEILVVNRGLERAFGVSATTAVPAHTVFDGAASDPRWACAGQTAGSPCTASLGTFAGLREVSVPFVVRTVTSLPLEARTTTLAADVTDNGAAGPDLDPTNNHAEASADLVGEPELTLAKAGPASARPGELLVYALTYSNAGTRETVGAFLEETVPPHTVFAASGSSAGWSCSDGAPAGTACRFGLGDLSVGGSSNVAFALRLASTVPAGADQVTNTATLGDEAGTPPATATRSTAIDAAPELILAKQGPATVAPGDLLVYTLTASNDGDRDAVGVVLAETVPAETTFVAAESTAGWSCPDDAAAGAACELSLGSLAAGSSPSSFRFAVRLASAIPAGLETVRNTAVLRADGAPEEPATVETPVDAAPELAVTKSAPALARPGDVILYTLGWANTGDQAASAAQLIESVPELTTFDASGSTGSWACIQPVGGPVACSLALGDLAAGESGEATFAVRLAASVPAALDQVDNVARLSAFEADSVQAAASTAIEASPRLVLTKSGPSQVAPGELLAYSLAYANQGDRDAVDVVLVETVPEHTAFAAAASSPGWSCADGAVAGTSCRLALGALPAGASGSAAFAVVVGTPPASVAAIANSALLEDGGGSPPGDDTTTTPITGGPNLSLAKSGPEMARPGDVLVYELAYANAGDRPAVGVVLAETVPENTTHAAGSSSPGWSCPAGAGAGSPCTLAVGDLAPGASGVALFAVTLADPLPAGVVQVSNTAVLAEDGGSPPDEDTTTTPISGSPVLTLHKSGPTVARPGQVIAYELAYTNIGDRPATSVMLVETVPAHTTFAAGPSTAGWSCGDGAGAGTACTLPVGGLGPGASGVAVFAVVLADPLPAGVVQVSNTAVLSGDGGSPPDEDEEVTPVDPERPVGEPLLAWLIDTVIEDDGDGLIGAGDVIGYTLHLEAIESVADVVARVPPDPATQLLVGTVTTTAGSIRVGDVAGDSVPEVGFGDMAAGATATMTFEVVIVDPVPVGTEIIAAQADILLGADAATVSDDPDTVEPLDPTVTELDTAADAIVEIPTLDHAGLALLVLVLAGAAFARLRRVAVG